MPKGLEFRRVLFRSRGAGNHGSLGLLRILGADGWLVSGFPVRRSVTKARAKLPEFGADLGSVRMVQVVQDRERLLPGRASLLRIPGGVAGVAEVAEGLGHAPDRKST